MPRPKCAVERPRQLGGAVGFDVDERQSPGTQGEQGVGHGGARAPGAEDHEAVERRAREAVGEAAPEARAVGVVATAPAIGEDDGVHRAERPATGESSSRCSTTTRLQGWVTLTPAKPARCTSREQRPGVPRLEPEGGEVEALVDVAQSELGRPRARATPGSARPRARRR